MSCPLEFPTLLRQEEEIMRYYCEEADQVFKEIARKKEAQAATQEG